MSMTSERSGSSRFEVPSARVAGGLLAVVGALNLALAVLSLATELVDLSAGAAGALLTAGLVTAALGTLVWRRNRLATVVAFTVFTMLLGFQVTQVATHATDGLEEGPLTRFGVLVLMVVALGVAAWHTRGRRR